MDDKRLAEIRALLAETEQARERLHGVMGSPDRPRAPMVIAANDLLAEADRLRTDNDLLEATISGTERLCDKLRAENAAMRDFLQRFVAYDDNPYVYGPVTPNEARALLAKNPA